MRLAAVIPTRARRLLADATAPSGALRRIGRAAVGPGLAAAAVLAMLAVVAGQERAAVETDLAAAASRTLALAEAPIAAATDALAGLALGGSTGCAEAAIAAFRGAMRGPLINVGVVDADGYLLCAGGPIRTPAEKVLSPLTPRMPTVAIDADIRLDRRRVFVAWTTEAGARLVAEIDPNLPTLAAGPTFAGRMAIAVSLGDGRIWRATNPAPADLADDAHRAATGSVVFPLSVAAALPAGVAPAGFAAIRSALTAIGVVLGVALAVLGWLAPAGARGGPSRKPAPAGAAARPFYWPVYQIDTRRLIGLDLVLASSDNPNVAADGVQAIDPAMLDRVLTEMSPLMRRAPDLRLSLPVDVRSEASERVIAHLPAAAGRLGIDPQALVIRVPSEATADPDARARLGRLRALDCAIASDGAGAGRFLVLSDPLPDFLFLDGRLAAELATSEEALLITEAAVGLARRLGLGVIARGVESEEGLAVLQAVGVTSGAGPVFGRFLNARAAADAFAAAAAPETRQAA